MRCLLRGLLRVPLSRLRTLRSSNASDANKSELQGEPTDCNVTFVGGAKHYIGQRSVTTIERRTEAHSTLARL